VPGPSPWPWVLLALVAFAVVAAAGWRRWYGLLALLVVVAVAADAIHTAGAFAASTAPVVAKVYGKCWLGLEEPAELAGDLADQAGFDLAVGLGLGAPSGGVGAGLWVGSPGSDQP
jgi:hypothetical protein